MSYKIYDMVDPSTWGLEDMNYNYDDYEDKSIYDDLTEFIDYVYNKQKQER